MVEGSCDVMVLAPHPDDAEMACGGTILQLVGRGARVVVVDMTRGEKATLGTPAQRRTECDRASAVLGIAERRNLELQDGSVRDDETSLAAVLAALRTLRPKVLLAPMDRDAHPDHAATGAVAARAFFLAGVAKVAPELGAAWRPRALLHYPLHHELRPWMCVDISAVAERKLEAVRCYGSQIPGDAGQRGHLLALDVAERARARDAFYGAQVGCRAAEPFAGARPLKLDASLFSLL